LRDVLRIVLSGRKNAIKIDATTGVVNRAKRNPYQNDCPLLAD